MQSFNFRILGVHKPDWKKLFGVILIICCSEESTGKKCPGTCSEDVSSCKMKGGIVLGYCTNQFACCDVKGNSTLVTTMGCGDKRAVGIQSVEFRSKFYPKFSSGDLLCTFDFPYSEEAVGVKIHFVDAYMDGVSFREANCESDAFHFQGFKTWRPPPLCGNLTGYSVVVERQIHQNEIQMEQLRIVALMSSPNYRWRIKLTEITQSQLTKIKSHLQGPMSIASKVDAESISEITGMLQDVDGNRPEEPMIIHGHDTNIEKARWQASLRLSLGSHMMNSKKKNVKTEGMTTVNEWMNKAELKLTCTSSQGIHFCGGSIVDEYHIVSAAHCFFAHRKLSGMLPLDRVKIVLGETDICANDNETLTSSSNMTELGSYEIETVILHYAYDPIAFINDVVVIKLKREIQFNERVQKIRLAAINETFDNQLASCSGWGRVNLTDNSVPLPNILQSSQNFVVSSQKDCSAYNRGIFGMSLATLKDYPKYSHVFESFLCTTSVSNSLSDSFVGQGDSGGPLVILGNGTTSDVLIGVVSFYYSLVKPKYDGDVVDIYMSISHFRHWIDLAMTDSSL